MTKFIKGSYSIKRTSQNCYIQSTTRNSSVNVKTHVDICNESYSKSCLERSRWSTEEYTESKSNNNRYFLNNAHINIFIQVIASLNFKFFQPPKINQSDLHYNLTYTGFIEPCILLTVLYQSHTFNTNKYRNLTNHFRYFHTITIIKVFLANVIVSKISNYGFFTFHSSIP